MRVMYSLEFKARAVVHYCEFLRSLRKVSKRYGIGKSTLARWVQKWGKEPRQKRPKRTRAKTRTKILEFFEQNPFASAKDAVEHLKDHGVHVSTSTVYRNLRANGYSYKLAQSTRSHVGERPEHPFFSFNDVYSSSMSVDECSFSLTEPPRRGWSRKGARVKKGKAHKGKRLSLLMAIDCDGVVDHMTVTGGVNASKFVEFVDRLPCGRPVILDNASIHKARVVKDAMARRHMLPLHPPPYSPWFNPIEMAFSWLKGKRRRENDRSMEDLIHDRSGWSHYGSFFDHCETLWKQDATEAKKVLKGV